jgi:vacuolar protein sorting-associated protein 13A/C
LLNQSYIAYFSKGYLGELKLKIPWRYISTQPCEVYLENLYVLVVPAASSKVGTVNRACISFELIAIQYDPKEEEERALAIKQARLESAELLQLRTQSDTNQGVQFRASYLRC